MERDQEKVIARIAGIILFLGGIIVISMVASKAIDSDDNFYYTLSTLFLITGVFLFCAHYFQDLNLELAFYITLMSFLLTFALCFTKSYDDITSGKDYSFVPGINDEGIAMIGMSVFYTLFFVFLLVFIYRKINTESIDTKSIDTKSIYDLLIDMVEKDNDPKKTAVFIESTISGVVTNWDETNAKKADALIEQLNKNVIDPRDIDENVRKNRLYETLKNNKEFIEKGPTDVDGKTKEGLRFLDLVAVMDKREKINKTYYKKFNEDQKSKVMSFKDIILGRGNHPNRKENDILGYINPEEEMSEEPTSKKLIEALVNDPEVVKWSRSEPNEREDREQILKNILNQNWAQKPWWKFW